MNDFYNRIEYVVPENTEIVFNILPETRHVYLMLLDGVADIYLKDEKIRLPLQQEFSIQFWNCLCPRLKTRTGCNLFVHGNHYVSSAIQQGPVKNTLFVVSPNEKTYSFVLDKDIQLEIFSVKSTEKESSVTITSSQGTPETSGFKLSRQKTYNLSPFSPILLKSSDDKPYSIYVNGLDRKAKLSIRDEKHHKCVNDVKDRIFAGCLSGNQYTNPTILVLGPKNAGKTSFCRLLVNEALEKEITPIYIDLNVKRNSSVPGSLSFSVIESPLDGTFDFEYNFQRLLHYGSLPFTSVSMGLYYFLVRKMGRLLSFHLNYYNKEKSLSIIDTDGYHGENKTSIELFLTAFHFDLVVYMGDEGYYDNLKKSTLECMPSEFIPKPRNAQQPSELYESMFYQHRIQKYFFGSNIPSTRNARSIAFCLINVYRITSTSLNIPSAINEKPSDYKIERIDLNPSMLYHLFGVSVAKRVELHGITEVKYYVYFTNIDMTAKTATVMVPESENFNGGILLMGHVVVHKDEEFI